MRCILIVFGLIAIHASYAKWEIQNVRSANSSSSALSVLHLSRHAGCMRDIESIFKGIH